MERDKENIPLTLNLPEEDNHMIEKIIEYSAKNKFIVLTMVICATLLGWWCMQNVPLDAIPDLTDTQVRINQSLN